MATHLKLELPNVTFIMQETRAHSLALLATQECVKAINFAEVLIFTDRPLEFSSLTHICNPRIIAVPNWSDKLGWCRHIWFGVPRHVRTSHMLLQQWDAGVWDTSCWNKEFLNYDYIGAIWPFHDNKKVGNSGFCLKSTRLARYLYSHRDKYPCDSILEDDLLCRKYRPRLEDVGFVWAPEDVARRFAFECEEPNLINKHFGWHGCFNFPIVLDYESLRERVELMAASPDLCQSQMMKWLREKHPNVIDKILDQNNSGIKLQAAE